MPSKISVPSLALLILPLATCVSSATTQALRDSTFGRYPTLSVLEIVSHGILIANANVPSFHKFVEQDSGSGVGFGGVLT